MAKPTIAHPFQPAKLLLYRDVIERARRGPTPGPISLEWDLSNTCPHDCPFCSFGTSESQGYRQQHWQHFPIDRALALPAELAAAGVQSVTFTGGGEPLMHPEVDQIMRATAVAGIEFGLVTNGMLIGRVLTRLAGDARFVRVSLDAGSNETHAKLHRPKDAQQFDKIMDGMKALRAIADDAFQTGARTHALTIGASFCVTDENWQELGRCAARLKAIGVNYLEVRPTFPTTWRGDGWGLALSSVAAAIEALQEARSAYDDDQFSIIGMIERFDALEHPDKGYTRCQIGPLMSVLGADGRLWHCCVQRGQAEFDLGSVLHVPFADAWKVAQARHMGEKIDVLQCPRCRYDNYNRLLSGLQSDAMHTRFL
jgi:MoaA/NifB/PqqE/SkfB family radical SAM enzyme